jgi:hypothetical protein
MTKNFRRWGAVYIILALFAGSVIAQWCTQWVEFAAEQASHGETADLSGYLPGFLASTFENWQSEFLQLAVQAILIASFLQAKLFRADFSADKEDVDRLEAKLDAILGQRND